MEKRKFQYLRFSGNLIRPAILMLIVVLAFQNIIKAQVIIATDEADNYITWTNGSNEGFGFEPWMITSDGNAGAFIGDPAVAGISDMDVNSFGLFANPEGGNFVNAERNFFQPLPVGATFSFQWGVNWDSDGTGNKGINLYSGGIGGTEEININMGGSQAITINGAPMFNNYGTQAMILHFELISETELRVHGTGRDGNETYDNTFVISGAPDAVRFYASNLATGDLRQPYFNNLQFTFPDNAILTSDLTVDGVIITAGSSLNLDENTLTIADDGFFENNGTFTHGDGTVIFKNATGVRGNSQTQFIYARVDGTDVSFGPYTSGIPKSVIISTLEILSGNIIADGAPELSEGSTLFYRSGGSYTRIVEWNNPWNVRVGFETDLDLNINAWGGDISIRGNLTIDENSSLTVDDGTDSHDLIIEGDLILNGTLNLSGSFGRDLQIKGNWNRTGNFEHNQREVIFNGNGIQNINDQTIFSYIRINNPGGEVIMQNDVVVTDRMEVNPGAMLNMQDRIISGAGTFELMENGGLKIGHSEGITQSSEQGNIQVTDGRIYNPTATYYYIGNGDQFSGNGLPHTEAPKKLTIELADDEATFGINTGFGIVISLPGYFEIRRGVVVESTSFSLGRSVSGNGRLIISGGEYRFERSISELVPRLTGDYELTGGLIHLSSEGDQSLRGGKPYHNLTFSGSGVVTASATPDISGSVTIQDEKILDLGSSTFGSSETNLTMTGGRLIMSGARVLPDMGGDYNLTGGVIEFAGSSASHAVRGGSTREYFNIEISGTSVRTSGSGNIQIKENGSFIIKTGASFQIASNRAITGSGSFIMENLSTLFYGDANGITLESEGTGTDAGSVRTLNRSFNSSAGYGFIGGPEQVSGNGLPSQVLSILMDKYDASQTVTLSNPLTITLSDPGALTLNRGRLITNDNELVVASSIPDAIVSGPDNTIDFETSYIIGTLIRRVATSAEDYSFPVGTNDFVQITRLNFSQLDGTNPEVSVFFTPDNPSPAETDISGLGIEVDGTLLTERLNYGYWTLSSTGINSFETELSVTSRGHTNGGIMPESHAVIRRNNSSDNWQFPVSGVHNNSTQTGSGTDPITAVISSINSFSDYAIAFSEFGPLPVTWLSFNATVKGKNVELHWQTATETNNNYFTILRSQNGTDFHPIGKIYGAGSSNELLTYSYTDIQPLEGINYYKLRQTDFDGVSDYSHIVPVSIESKINPHIFFNKGNIHIQLPQNTRDNYHLRLYNLKGQILHSKELNTLQNGSYHILDTSGFPDRLLIVTLVGRYHSFSEKILISN